VRVTFPEHYNASDIGTDAEMRWRCFCARNFIYSGHVPNRQTPPATTNASQRGGCVRAYVRISGLSALFPDLPTRNPAFGGAWNIGASFAGQGIPLTFEELEHDKYFI
jgi:hypothetical protein